MKRKPIALAAVAAALVATAAWWWWTGKTMERVATFLPPLPELASAPPALRERLTSADAKARSHAGAARGLRELGRLYHANGFPAEAERCYRGLQELDPREPRWLHLQATILAGYGDTAPALALWRKVEALAPDYVPARLRLADCLFKSSQPEQAAAAYEAVLKLDPENPYAQLGLARIDLEAGRWDQARPRLEQVVAKSNYTLGYDLIVSLYERMGLAQRAIAIRSMAKASGAYRDPADPWLDRLIDDCLEPYRLSLTAGVVAHAGDAAQALRLLERAVNVAPEDVSVRFQLGTLLVQQGRLDDARAELERCTVLAPGFADAWAHLSSLLAQQGRAMDAARLLAEGLKHCPDSPGLHLMAARNHQRAGRLGEAIVEYQASIRLRPNEADAYLELGQLYIKADRAADGLDEIRRALAAEPGNTTALGILAFNAITTGSEDDARSWLARARQQPRIDGDQLNRLTNTFRQRFGKAP